MVGTHDKSFANMSNMVHDVDGVMEVFSYLREGVKVECLWRVKANEGNIEPNRRSEVLKFRFGV